jgi:hypothetical protein
MAQLGPENASQGTRLCCRQAKEEGYDVVDLFSKVMKNFY